MGMFDNIVGHIRCPYCGWIFQIDEQVKWTHEPCLHRYIIGDYIHADDGAYTTSPYSPFSMTCEHCEHEVEFKIVIKNGVLKAIKSTTKPTDLEIIDTKNRLEQKHREDLEKILKLAKDKRIL